MEITAQYIISQIFTVISYIFLATTYQAKSRKIVLTLNILSQIAFVVTYILLGAWSGLAMVIVALARNIFFILDEKKNGQRENINRTDMIILVIVYVISIVSAIYTYERFYSLLPVFATMLYTYAVCQKNIKTYKLLGIPTELLWTCYNIYIKSIFGILLEVVMLASCVTGYIREIKKINEVKEGAML